MLPIPRSWAAAPELALGLELEAGPDVAGLAPPVADCAGPVELGEPLLGELLGAALPEVLLDEAPPDVLLLGDALPGAALLGAAELAAGLAEVDAAESEVCGIPARGPESADVGALLGDSAW